MQRYCDGVNKAKNIIITAIISPASWKKSFLKLIFRNVWAHFSLQHQASNSKRVYLKAVTLKSTGVYRCEISAEEPDFKTVQGEGRLEVVCKYNRCAFLRKSWLSSSENCVAIKLIFAILTSLFTALILTNAGNPTMEFLECNYNLMKLVFNPREIFVFEWIQVSGEFNNLGNENF